MGEGLGKSGRLALVGDSPYTYVRVIIRGCVTPGVARTDTVGLGRAHQNFASNRQDLRLVGNSMNHFDCHNGNQHLGRHVA
jgi:hypothetical protein